MPNRKLLCQQKQAESAGQFSNLDRLQDLVDRKKLSTGIQQAQADWHELRFGAYKGKKNIDVD
jgi:hypothetical protein